MSNILSKAMAAVGGWIHEVATPENLARITGIAGIVWEFVLPFLQQYKDQLPGLLPQALQVVKTLDKINDIPNADKKAQAVASVSQFAIAAGHDIKPNVIETIVDTALSLLRISQQPVAASPQQTLNLEPVATPEAKLENAQATAVANSEEPSTFSLPVVPTDSIGGGDAAMENEPTQSRGDVDANDK